MLETRAKRSYKVEKKVDFDYYERYTDVFHMIQIERGFGSSEKDDAEENPRWKTEGDMLSIINAESKSGMSQRAS